MGNSAELMEASMRQPSASISRPRQHRPGQLARAAKKGVLPTHFHQQTPADTTTSQQKIEDR